jgi:hypothetical protein
VAEGLGNTFLDLALYGKTTQDWLKVFQGAYGMMAQAELGDKADYSRLAAPTAPPLSAEAYLGVFENELYGQVKVVRRAKGLAIQQGPLPRTFPLQYWERDTFTYETYGENAVGTAGVTFTIGPNGKALVVRIENLDKDGQGTFRRVSSNE